MQGMFGVTQSIQRHRCKCDGAKLCRDHSIHTAMTAWNCDAGIKPEGKFCDSGYEYPGKYVSVRAYPFRMDNQPSQEKKEVERYKKYKEMLNIKGKFLGRSDHLPEWWKSAESISCALAEYRCRNSSSGQPYTGN